MTVNSYCSSECPTVLKTSNFYPTFTKQLIYMSNKFPSVTHIWLRYKSPTTQYNRHTRAESYKT